MRLSLLTLFTALFGCATSHGPGVVVIDAGEYTRAFDAAVAVASSGGMKPLLLDRRSGVIETEPAIAGSIVEPWKPRASSPRQATQNTLAMQRRTARFEFTPVLHKVAPRSADDELIGPDLLSVAGQDLTTFTGQMELRVWVYVDRYYVRGIRRGTWSLQNETISEILPTEEPWEQVQSNFWVPMTRDIAREQALLAGVITQLHAE